MTVPAVQAPPVEANSAPAAEENALNGAIAPATDAIGTPGDPAADPTGTPTPDVEEPVRELIHSEETLTAARAEAEALGLDRGRRETAQQAQERRNAVAQSFRASGDEPAAYLKRWQSTLTDLEVPPEQQQAFLGDARIVLDQMVDAAMAVSGSNYYAALMTRFPDDTRRAAFNEKLGATEDAGEVFDVYADFVALDQPSVAKASPDELIKRNKGLATHIQSLVDAATLTGRRQGQVDPRGRELSADAAAAGAVPEWAAFQAMTPEQKEALGSEKRALIYEADRARRARVTA